MKMKSFLDPVNSGVTIEGGSDLQRFMHDAAREALQTIAEIDTGYRSETKVAPFSGNCRPRGFVRSRIAIPPRWSRK